MDRLPSYYLQVGSEIRNQPSYVLSVLLITAYLMLALTVQPAFSFSPALSSWFVDMERFANSSHRSIKCERCHSEFTVQGKIHPNREDPKAINRDPVRTYDYKRCASCHPEGYERYLKGEHAKALVKERELKASEGKEPEKMAPTCGSCHSSHYSQSRRSRVQLGTEMVEICGNCHKPQKAGYLANLHGRMGVFLGKEASAYCTDCHGAHTCQSLKDREKALEACRRCHRDANLQFAGIVIHGNPDDVSKKEPEKQKAVFITSTVKHIGQIVGVIVLGFFAIQTFVWVLRELHRKLRGR